jgi:hypothetical protein
MIDIVSIRLTSILVVEKLWRPADKEQVAPISISILHRSLPLVLLLIAVAVVERNLTHAMMFVFPQSINSIEQVID